MREETRRKLERALWRERAKKVAIGTAALAAIGLFFIYEDYDARVENARVPGTVIAVRPLNVRNTKMVEAGLSVDVTPDSGRRVNVIALKSTHPHVGDHVQITEHCHHTGRVSYSWELGPRRGLAPKPASSPAISTSSPSVSRT